VARRQEDAVGKPREEEGGFVGRSGAIESARQMTSGSSMAVPEASRSPLPPEERRLVEGMRAGNEDAFSTLVNRFNASLLRLAALYVRDRAVAEEVVQETWLSVIQGIDRFEGRSSLKTWIFRILMNKAKTRGVREGRSIPFSALASDKSGSAVEPERFLDVGHPTWAGHWYQYPTDWTQGPEQRLVSKEVRQLIEQEVDSLRPSQGLVIRLRDIEGCSSEEVCALLGISDGNQRILLHRARSKVRAALERYLDQETR
jgi:RNA polymerase sigma-70 factor (ECF subfamily)